MGAKGRIRFDLLKTKDLVTVFTARYLKAAFSRLVNQVPICSQCGLKPGFAGMLRSGIFALSDW
jgi:hypothetical protein